MSRQSRYWQSIKMKDADGISVTALLSETKNKDLYIEAWAAPKTNVDAVAHSLMLAAMALTMHPYVKGTLEMLLDFSKAKLVEGGFQPFPEGQAATEDDLPF